MKYTVVIIKISPILLNIYMALTIIFALLDVDNTPFDSILRVADITGGEGRCTPFQGIL